MKTKLVTVIIPVYNVELYLRECLDSVCNQTYTNLEIICVDDGSTDNCPSILQEYAQKDHRIKIITQKNAGQGAARNSALDIAQGEWIASVDSDDYLERTTIEKCINCFSDDIDVVIFGVRHFQGETTIQSPWLDMKFSGKIKITDTIIPQLQTTFWDKIWRSSFLKKWNLRFPDFTPSEDRVFVYCMLSVANHIYCLPDRFYNYRKREGSTMDECSKRKAGKRVLAHILAVDMCLAFWKNNNIREKLGCDANTPGYMEICSLSQAMTNMLNWGTPEIQHETWLRIRALIDKYELGARLPEFKELALYYHLPPYVMNELQNKMTLITNANYIYWSYRRYQLLSLLTWGKRRRKYQEKKRHYHELIRQCRQIKKDLACSFYKCGS